jgi:hypothetical protein
MKRPKKKAPPTRTAQLTTRQRSSTGQAQGQIGTFAGVYRSPGSMVAPGRASLKLSRKEQP